MRRSRASKDRWGNLKRSDRNEPVSRATTENYFGQPHKPGSVVNHRNTDKSDTRASNLWAAESQKAHDRIDRKDKETYDYW